MNAVEIYGANHMKAYKYIREACRGIVVENGKMLLCYEQKDDQWMIPGGGIEKGETHKECCARELTEETGYIVKVKSKVLTINEYYEDWLFISHYFICECIGKRERNLTQSEIEVGLEPKWLPIEEAIDAFSKYQSYAAENEMKRGMYLREYTALTSIFDIKDEHMYKR